MFNCLNKLKFWVNDQQDQHGDLYRFSHIYRSADDGKWRLVLVEAKQINKRLAIVMEPQGDLLLED